MIVNILLIISGVLTAAAVLMALVRFLLGPTVYDRIASIDVMTLITTALLVFLSVMYGKQYYMDVAIVYSILSFIGVVAFARFMEKKND